MDKYILKLETKLGPIVLEDLDEYVFAKKYLYYSKDENGEDCVGRIPREVIYKAFRLLKGSSKWIEIKMKQFKE